MLLSCLFALLACCCLLFVYIYIYIYTHTYTCTYTCTCTCTYIYIYAYITYMHYITYIYIYMCFICSGRNPTTARKSRRSDGLAARGEEGLKFQESDVCLYVELRRYESQLRRTHDVQPRRFVVDYVVCIVHVVVLCVYVVCVCVVVLCVYVCNMIVLYMLCVLCMNCVVVFIMLRLFKGAGHFHRPRSIPPKRTPKRTPKPRKYTPVAWGILSSWSPYVCLCS